MTDLSDVPTSNVRVLTEATAEIRAVLARIAEAVGVADEILADPTPAPDERAWARYRLAHASRDAARLIDRLAYDWRLLTTGGPR